MRSSSNVPSRRTLRVAVLGFLFVFACVAVVHVAFVSGTEETEKQKDASSASTESKAPKKKYVTPSLSGNAFFFDGFDNGLGGWTVSGNSKFTGRWEVRKPSALIGNADDNGLQLMDDARHHAIFRRFDTPIDNTDKDFVVQYEVKFQQNHECGGAYLKLVHSGDSEDKQLTADSDFSNDVPYAVMFGPDKCGATNKVHLIIRHKNPKNNKWEEKHLKNAPTVPTDLKTHLYTLILRTDNSFEILIDNESASKGSLLEDFEPSFNPPKEIDDPTDIKPEDWVEEAKIPDPDAKKPEDWDEDAPEFISDENDSKPDTWLDNEPEMVPDPDAKKPEDWDDEEDGDWEAPRIKNPKCEEYGCGDWKPKTIPNPKYKGKWNPPLIDNPAYKGPWKARQIPNPDFFEDKNPHNLPTLIGIGLELWTMQGQMLFDNFLITDSEEVARVLAEKTWSVKNEREVQLEKEEAKNKKDDDSSSEEQKPTLFAMLRDVVNAPSWEGSWEYLKDAFRTHPLPLVGILVGIFIGVPLLLSRSFKRKTVEVEEDREEEELPASSTSTVASTSNDDADAAAARSDSASSSTSVRSDERASSVSNNEGNQEQDEDVASPEPSTPSSSGVRKRKTKKRAD